MTYRAARNALVGIVDQAAAELHGLRKTLHQPDPVALTVPKAANVPLNVPSFVCADAGANCARISAIATQNRSTLWGPRTLVFIFALRDMPDYRYGKCSNGSAAYAERAVRRLYLVGALAL